MRKGVGGVSGIRRVSVDRSDNSKSVGAIARASDRCRMSLSQLSKRFSPAFYCYRNNLIPFSMIWSSVVSYRDRMKEGRSLCPLRCFSFIPDAVLFELEKARRATCDATRPNTGDNVPLLVHSVVKHNVSCFI